MHIGLISETFWPDINGVSMTLAQWSQGLLDAGDRLDLITPHANADTAGLQGLPWQDSRPFRHMSASRVPLPGYRGVKLGLMLPKATKRLWRKSPPDVLYIATEGLLGLDALRYARQNGIPVVGGFHTNFQYYLHHYHLQWLTPLMRAYLRRFHNACTRTLTPTQAQKKQLLRQQYHRIHRVGRGVDLSQFFPRTTQERSLWRQQHGISDDTLLLGYTGRLAAEKNLSQWIESYQILKSQHPSPVKALIVGDGPWRDHVLSALPDALWMGELTGEALAIAYSAMDIFSFPSMTETYGNVVPEALASGTPVIAFDCAAAHELLQPGKNGDCVGVNEAEDYTARLIHLAHDYQQSPQRWRTASAKSIHHLGWPTVNASFRRHLVQAIHEVKRHGRQRSDFVATKS